MAIYDTQGIILKKIDFGEASQIFSFYTQDFGKLIIIGQGTKKIVSKLNSSLQFFSVINISIVKGKNYDKLTAASIYQSFPNIMKDLKKTFYANFALELINKLTKASQADVRIFLLLKNFLTGLNQEQQKSLNSKWRAWRHDFIVKILGLLGYLPDEEIASDEEKLNNFLSHYLEKELLVEKVFNNIALD
ncbi:MAG: DNA repair protein RecO [Candidatus Magasanikbacteria bacterium]|nr:DNA repair protein RecO [Candidatus Magasanikbacteria bacterium]